MFIMSFIMMIIFILISVAFVTLLERKVLGYIQMRKGPNKLGFVGLLQPFSDGLKLFFKEQMYPYKSNFIIYYLSPMFMMLISFILWCLFPYVVNVVFFIYGFLFLISFLGLSVYGIMLSGWSSNSNYSMLGAIRSIAQTISYEVSMTLLVLGFVFLTGSFNFHFFMIYQEYVWFVFFSFPIFFSWFSSCLAETSRLPFDFAEGESELVSGFNVEYSSVSFAFIFLSEYMNIIFMSTFTCIMFLGSDLLSLFFFLKVLLLIFAFVWVRASLPRYRYDKLMYLTWKCFLPISLNYLMVFFNMLIIINIIYFIKNSES